ncbi:MAG TPA: flagellar hook-associated protein FlgK [Anaerovoracaceae bacterium]|nr:flagellar hook-associated protein FlgK [Anaerovoracaceae bacterium]
MAIRPTFMAFQTAGRAIAANQANIDVTGNNIANVETKGYSRQRVDQTSLSNSGYTQKYALGGYSVGLGVEITNINQYRDPFLDARFREQSGENGKLKAIINGLEDLENIFDEASTVGLKNEFSMFINELQTLSQTPAAADIALITRTAAQKVTQILNVYSNQISQVREQQVFDLDKVLIQNDFNTKVKNLANLNDQIRKEQTYGNTPNELYDHRNLLIDELSEMANIKVSSTPEKISEDIIIERLTVSLYDTVTGTSIGLVDNGLYNTLYLVDDGSEARIGISTSFSPPENSDITDYISGGALNGYLSLINGEGLNEFKGIPYYNSALDVFASNFARLMNDLNTLDPAESKPLFEALGGGDITAANIRISKQWLDDPAFITTSLSESDSPDNILRMISAMDSPANFYKDANDPASLVMFKGSFHDYLSALIGEIALDVELQQNYRSTSESVLTGLFESKESISGVSLNEEGINLMAYQKSYNAAMRYFTVLDEAVDAIINKMGIVGR